MVAAATLALGSPGASPATATELHFPVADTPELFGVQKTMVEAWTILQEAYVDPSLNNLNWPEELATELAAVAQSPSPVAASQELVAMVRKLGDPFTRWVSAHEYAEFRVTSDGELKGGVGLLIAQDPASGRLMVLAPIKGSPADRAGIRPGDEVLAVDGTPTVGWDGDAAAKVLRGESGSSVMVEVARRRLGDVTTISMNAPTLSNGSNDAVPGVAGPRPGERDIFERKRFRLRRERVELSPIFATIMHYDDHAFGYVRLVNFSQHAAADMAQAIAQLKKDGAEAFILDLRNNPGGLVKASLEVASLWMDGDRRPTVFSVQDRAGSLEEGERVQRVVLDGGKAATDAPMVVLVNRQSASASEILAGALHDNKRAEVIGGTWQRATV